MSRVSMSVASRRRRKKVLKQARGYRGGRSKLYKSASEAIDRAMAYAYRGRKERKRDFRALWIARINAAARENSVSYSVFINALKKSNILLDRKMLAELAVKDSEVFKAVLDCAMATG